MILALCAAMLSGCKPSQTTFEESVPDSSSQQDKNTVDSSEEDAVADSSKEDTQDNSETITSSKDETTSKKPETVETTDINDKPSSYEMAYYSSPINSQFDAEAKRIRDSVLNAADSINVSGRKWYISNKGNDSNDGSSPATAWATSNALRTYKDKINAGDAVLFERGGVFRGGFEAESGVSYGAYGSGDKPCIYGSYKAGNGRWTDLGSNVWRFEGANFSVDIGMVVFDHGKAVGTKKATATELTKECDFAVQGGKVFVYMGQNPTTVYKSIELAVNTHLISVPAGSSNIVFDNLTVKYSGGHGIRTNNGSSNITIKNCEMAWIGGAYLSSDGTRYGNAIEFWQGIDTALVTNCWIYQIYDSGVTHQGPDAYVAKNVTVTGNLIEYCGFGSIEYWHNQRAYNSMENIEYSSNVLRFAGFGVGSGRAGIGYHIHSNGTTNDNKATNFVIKNNIFDLAYRVLLDIRGGADTMPYLLGNTYSQYDGRYLGCYGSDIINETFDTEIDGTIRSFDQNANIIHNANSR